MTVLENENDFNWYKKGLDVSVKYKHRHNGEPERYPCVVKSVWEDAPDGPYTYTHSFIYKQKIVCEKCGNAEEIWPDIAKE